MLIIVALVAVWRCFTKDAPEQPDNVVFFQFVRPAGRAVGSFTTSPSDRPRVKLTRSVGDLSQLLNADDVRESGEKSRSANR